VLLILVGLLCLLLLSGCTTTSAVVAGSRAAVGSLNVREPIMLLPPKLTYERIQNEQPLDGAEFQASAVVASLLAAARQSLQQKGLAVIGEVSAGNAEVRHPLEGLSARADALFHSPIDPSLVEQLRQVQPAGEDRAVLVQYVRVKVGPGGFWDPNTGVIHSKMSSANLRAAILRCRDGQLLWRNEVFLREVPRVNSSKFRKAVQLLYQP
jgi:hypothetical protein